MLCYGVSTDALKSRVQTSPLSETIISKAHSEGWAFVLEYLT